MAEILQGLGYPLSAIAIVLVLAYFGRQVFEKILNTLIEEKKADLTRAIEERKAELGRETEQLKTSLAIEAETYRLAAQRRFNYLLELWENSESLFEDTDFSDVESIQNALKKVDESIVKLNRYSVLFPPSVVIGVRSYLENVARVLTNSEKDFDEDAITADKISDFLKMLSNPIGMVHPTLSIAASIGAELAPSVGKFLEEHRLKAANETRQQLQLLLRHEFGVWVTEEKPLVAAT